MSRKLVAVATMAAALTAGGAAGFALGAPLVSGAQESTTTIDGGTTTTEEGTAAPKDDGTAEEGTAEDRPDHEGRGPGDCGQDGEAGSGDAGSGDAETEGTSAST